MRLPSNLTKLAGKIFLKLKDTSPEICVVGGLVCGGAALVIVGVNTWKNKETIQEDVKEAKAAVELTKAECDDKAVVAERKKVASKACVTVTKDIVKTYWLPAVLSGTSVVLIWGGRSMLRKNLVAMTSAYMGVMESYKAYRQRVVEDAGNDKDFEYATGLKVVEHIDEATGAVEQKIESDGRHVISRYARWFDEGEFDSRTGTWTHRNHMWKNSPLSNEAFLRERQNHWNDILTIRGYVFLNEVLDSLGIEPIAEGQDVGWTTKGGDGYIDFGLFPCKDHPYISPVNRLFLDGKSPNCLLDFNVEGDVRYALKSMFGEDYAEKLLKS